MNSAKKIVVILPALLVSVFFLGTHYAWQYGHATQKRLLALIIAVLFFYIWMGVGALRRKQNTFFDILVQLSFYVYTFSVLTLTGYFILFNQASAHDWWRKMLQRVHLRDGVNLVPFAFMKAHHLLTYEVVGNFIMLLPLGIYLPLLYRKINGFFRVTLVALLVSVSIELMQLATSVRVADIDDVILNTAGASFGFIIYFIIRTWVIKSSSIPQKVQAYS